MGLVRDLKDADWALRGERLQLTLPGRVATKFSADNAGDWAVQIAWYALLSMFPILLTAAGVLGLVLSLAGIGGEDVRRNLADAIPAGDAQQQVVTAVEQFKQASGLLAVVGFAGLLLSGSALFTKMDVAFAHAYGVKPRRLVRQRVMSVGMILLFTALVGLDIGSALLLPVLKNLVGHIPLTMTRGALSLVGQVVLGTVLSSAFFVSTYYVVPNRAMRLREAVPGALVAGVLLELVTLVFPLYVELNSTLQKYGQTFGLMFVLMTFFFVLGLVLMVGVEVNTVVDPRLERVPEPASVIKRPER
jgi:membrane protein